MPAVDHDILRLLQTPLSLITSSKHSRSSTFTFRLLVEELAQPPFSSPFTPADARALELADTPVGANNRQPLRCREEVAKRKPKNLRGREIKANSGRGRVIAFGFCSSWRDGSWEVTLGFRRPLTAHAASTALEPKRQTEVRGQPDHTEMARCSTGEEKQTINSRSRSGAARRVHV